VIENVLIIFYKRNKLLKGKKKMKKLLTALLVAGLLMGSVFAGTVSAGEGAPAPGEFTPTNVDCTPTCVTYDIAPTYFMLNGKVDAKEYAVGFKYNGNSFASLHNFVCFDLEQEQNRLTKMFSVDLTDGNCCGALTAKVTVTCDPFKDICCVSDATVPTTVIPAEVTVSAEQEEIVYDSESQTFTTPIPCGYHDLVNIANFNIGWDYIENLDAGKYQAMGKIAITIS
jgi:hypothetical protein